MGGGAPPMAPQAAPRYHPWDDAALVATLFAVDPSGVGGVCLRALPGPVRDQWLADTRELLPHDMHRRKIPLHVTDGRLLGGLDLTATLRAGRPVAEHGLLAEAHGGVVELAMAERVRGSPVSYLCAALDTGEVVLERDGIALRSPARLGVIALDEGSNEDEQVADALLDRLAFLVDLSPIGVRDMGDLPYSAADIGAARDRLPAVTISEAQVSAICETALALGIYSLRAALHAVHAARIAAALDGDPEVTDGQVNLAARLVMAPRATQMPYVPPEREPEPPPPEPPPPDQDQGESDQNQEERKDPLADQVLEAAKAAIPQDLLDRLRLGQLRRAKVRSTGKSGQVQQANMRGRPAGVRRGDLRPGDRLNLIETLRAAAPWQRVRRAERERGQAVATPVKRKGRKAAAPAMPRVEVRKDDFRIQKYKHRSETTAIFVVDASGSSALHRLGEAKGAVELLLADCYVRRDRVALVAFRGKEAELLLPPTRSLVRTKRCLADLPGGGGTPLASGIETGLALADAVKRRGGTPLLVILTDGRANVARNGQGGRPQATEEALTCSRLVRASGVAAMVVDTSNHPHPQAKALAEAMDATYMPLPHADAGRLNAAVKAKAGI
ncbi:magnesium chelatase subunit D [uncultured Thiodictyon sp.]|uniref:magnesium chelatase subunit D n=1 Tax=uncultured Thiodictyon sp. TaxID=1846217 RepID=UPI0025EE1223|nr:magnesium chelatase subunit D [uncultured Thiodictyon sp.]